MCQPWGGANDAPFFRWGNRGLETPDRRLQHGKRECWDSHLAPGLCAHGLDSVAWDSFAV